MSVILDVHTVSPGPSPLPVLSLRERQDKQQDNARVLFYVSTGKKPSRCERSEETLKVLKTLMQWEKLKMLDGILYQVCKGILMGKKRLQYLAPAYLVKQVLRGVHDEAGHIRVRVGLCLLRDRGSSGSV